MGNLKTLRKVIEGESVKYWEILHEPRRGVGRYEMEGNAAYLVPAMQSHVEFSLTDGTSLSGLQILVVGNRCQSGWIRQESGQY
jgi:hypothetical protein